MRRALAAALLLIAAGCLPNATREPQRFYILEAAEPRTGPARVPRPATLSVPATSSSSFYDTQDLVYSRQPGTRAYYQFNSWTERPGRAFHEALVARLERSGTFRSVVGSDATARNGLVLRTHLEEIYHDAAQRPGTARIALSAELLNAGGEAIARQSFNQSASASSYDAAGAVQGFRQAVATLLDEIVAWVDEHAPR